MGIERARVVEVHGADSPAGAVGSGYQITDRLVLTAGRLAGRHGPTAVRPAGTAVWVIASVVWRAPAGDVAVLDVDDPSVLVLSPADVRWGRVTGSRPVAVTAMGFPATTVRPERARDAEQFLGHVTAAVGPGAPATTMAVTPGGSGASAGGGLSGAALFAGPDVVGVLLADTDHDGRTRLGAVSAGDLADDPTFAGLVGGDDGLTVTSVRTAWSGFPILQAP